MRIAPAFALALSLGVVPTAGLGVGCGGTTPDAVVTPDDHVVKAPPMRTADPLPPAPVPETFDVAALAEQVRPLVVNITTTQQVGGGGAPFDFFFGPGGRPPGERIGAGTGFIIDPSGYIITNEHVVRDADEVRVVLADDRELPADVVGRDPELDLALLRVRGASALAHARLGSSDDLRVGEHVLAVGNPFGLGHTVTLGIVSAKARTIGAGPYDNFIQTDASINPGNSGGPLFNWRGEVVGINTAIRAGANGIGFAIPIDSLKDVLEQLKDTGHVVRGKLGLLFQPLTPELATALKLERPHGALVSQVQPGSAAERAGIKAGDVIIEVEGSEIRNAEELPRNVARNPPGSKISLKVLRAGKQQSLQATLDTLEQEDSAPAPTAPSNGKTPHKNGRLGIEVSDVAEGGVRVERIEGGSPARELRPGDVIVQLNGRAIVNVEQLRAGIADLKPGAMALLRIRRGSMERYAAVPMPK